MAITRRSIIGRGALLVASGILAPSFVTRTALALQGQPGLTDAGPVVLDATKKDRILVVLQLSGGNDGINTLVPFGDPGYGTLRPTLGIVDPDNTRELPAMVAACSGFDVLSHAIESFTPHPFKKRAPPQQPCQQPAERKVAVQSGVDDRHHQRHEGRHASRQQARQQALGAPLDGVRRGAWHQHAVISLRSARRRLRQGRIGHRDQ